MSRYNDADALGREIGLLVMGLVIGTVIGAVGVYMLWEYTDRLLQLTG